MKRSYKALIALAIGAIVAAAAFAATGFAGSEKSTLNLVAGPVPFVEEGGDGFTIAKLINNWTEHGDAGRAAGRPDIQPGRHDHPARRGAALPATNTGVSSASPATSPRFRRPGRRAA